MRKKNNKSIREQRVVPITSTHVLKKYTTIQEEKSFVKRCEKLNEK